MVPLIPVLWFEIINSQACNYYQILNFFHNILGSLVRSNISGMAGARTQMHGLVVSFFTLFTMLFLQPLFEYLPQVTLAGIIFVFALSIIEFRV